MKKIEAEKRAGRGKNSVHKKPQIVGYENQILYEKMSKEQMSPEMLRELNMKERLNMAKKGMQLLLNNLSDGNYCPEIETHFSGVRQNKVAELVHKAQIRREMNDILDAAEKANKNRNFNSKNTDYKKLKKLVDSKLVDGL